MAISKSYKRNQSLNNQLAGSKRFQSVLGKLSQAPRINRSGNEKQKNSLSPLLRLARAACLIAIFSFAYPFPIVLAAEKTTYKNVTVAIEYKNIKSPVFLQQTVLGQDVKTLEGRLFNLANQEVVGATATLNTDKNPISVTTINGYRFDITDFPTSIFNIYNNQNILEPGNLTREIFDISGRRISIDNFYLNSYGGLENFNDNIRGLLPGSMYIQRITDTQGHSIRDKFIAQDYSRLPSENVVGNSILANNLKSANMDGNSTVSDYFGYKIKFTPSPENVTFAETSFDVHFPKTDFYHYEDFFVNEFPLVFRNYNGERFSGDTLKLSLLDLIKTDDALKYELIFNSENTSAFTRYDSLVIYGTTNFDVKAIDTKGQSVIMPGLNFEQYISLVGFTMDLAKDTSLNASNTYIVTEPDFIEKRKQGNMRFRIFNKDNSFIEDLVSDENGVYSVELPAKGKYGIEIMTEGMHPMMYMVIADSVKNNENIAGINKSFSTFNFAQSHIGCYVDDNGKLYAGKLDESVRTFCWDPEILKKGIELIFLNRIVSDITAKLSDTITQEMKDLIINDIKRMNPYFNNFFGNVDDIIYVDDLSRFQDKGIVSESYGVDMPFGGGNGTTFRNGVVVRTSVGLNKEVYDEYFLYGYPWIFAVDFQENASMYGAFFEGWVEEAGKPSNWYKGSPYTTFTEDSKKAQMFYNWLSNKFISEGTPAEGFHPSLITSRIAKEFAGNVYVTNYIRTNEIEKVKEKYNIK